jgi:hypothetical protein
MIEQKLEELQGTTIEWLPVNLLRVDPNYQRPAGPKKIKAISDNFKLTSAGVLLVSQRSNGQYFVMDGQHRLEAMKKLDIQFVECKVYRGLSAKEEAETFIFCNLVRKNPTAIDVFKARLFTEDPIAVEIKKIVEKHGLFILSTNTAKKSPKDIRAIAAIEEVYTRYGAPFLEEILILLARTWDGELSAFDTTLIEGITDFHLKYQGLYTRDEFIRKVGITDARMILRRASYLKENYGEAMYKGVSRAIQEAYDKGRRIRLPDRLQQTEDK